MHLPLRTRTTIWPIVTLAAFALAVPATAGARGGGKSGGGPSGSPSHGAHGHQGAQPSRGKAQSRGSARSRGKARSKGKAGSRGNAGSPGRAPGGPTRPSSPSGPSARGSSPARPADKGGPSRSQADRSDERKGKVTICHATGSSTNPYVEITVSESALKAHRGHQDGEDLIGVPAGGCPGGGPAAAPRQHAKVTICHATGSATNPFVTITVAAEALAAHTRHQHGEDVVGTAGECTAQAPASTAQAPASTAQAPAPVPESTPAGPSGARAAAPSGSGVGGVEAGSADPSAATADRAESRSAGRDRDSLPFTGLAVFGLALAGAASLAAGKRLRRHTV